MCIRVMEYEGRVTCRWSHEKKTQNFGLEAWKMDVSLKIWTAIKTQYWNILKKQGRMVQDGLIWGRVGAAGLP